VSADGHVKPAAVVDGEIDVRMYNGAAAQEILDLLTKAGALKDGKPYYRGLHFFVDQERHASFYLQTYVETQHLLRGLRGLGLRPDHPIFRTFN
jgi:hypothetical protein